MLGACLQHQFGCTEHVERIQGQMSRTATDGSPIGYRRTQGPNEGRTGAKWKGRYNKRSGETREVIGTKEVKKEACPEVLRTPGERVSFPEFWDGVTSDVTRDRFGDELEPLPPDPRRWRFRPTRCWFHAAVLGPL